ncbi:MAG: hypothetical protein ACM3NR_03205 [Methanosarcina sp.]
MNPLDTLNIGIKKLVKDWLDLYGIPFNEDDFRYLKNGKDSVMAIEVPVDKELMMQNYKDSERGEEGKFIPSFVKDGEVVITFKF